MDSICTTNRREFTFPKIKIYFGELWNTNGHLPFYVWKTLFFQWNDKISYLKLKKIGFKDCDIKIRDGFTSFTDSGRTIYFNEVKDKQYYDTEREILK